MIDIVGSCRRKAEKQSELNDDQDERKHDSRQRDRESHFVMKQVSSR